MRLKQSRSSKLLSALFSKSSSCLAEIEPPLPSPSNRLDVVRKTDFPHLDLRGDVYLDHTGSALAPAPLVREHANMLLSRAYGNPHSVNPTSTHSSIKIEEARSSLLKLFDAPPETYEVIFTANATAALKLVGEHFFGSSQPGETILLPVDGHSSVLGLREFAKASGASVEWCRMGEALEWVEDEVLNKLEPKRHGLCVLTGQSNLTGAKAQLSSTFLRTVRQANFSILLDAAALAPTSAISIKSWGCELDAMAISLYKVFGYPTGVGALIVRKDFLPKLKRKWFCGGTVAFIQAPGNQVVHANSGHELYEEGTMNFQSLLIIPFCVDYFIPLLPLITHRLPILMRYTLAGLSRIVHSSKLPVVRIEAPTGTYNPSKHGALVALNIQDMTGQTVAHKVVERAAGAANISVRSGCMCNHGAGLRIARVDPTSVKAPFPQTLDGWLHAMNVKEDFAGVVRVSFGLTSNFEDAEAFIRFARRWVDDGTDRMIKEFT